MELAGVGDEAIRPAAACVGAVAGLEPGFDVAERDPFTTTGVAHGTGRAGRLDAPGQAAQHGLDDDPATTVVVDVTHDLVASTKGMLTMGSK